MLSSWVCFAGSTPTRGVVTGSVQHPDFPAALAPFVVDGLLEGLSTLELGALYRLLAYAWRNSPPCTVPRSRTSLVAVTGVTVEEWDAIKNRLFLALEMRLDDTDRNVIVLGAASRVYQSILAEADQRRQRTRNATEAAAKLRRERPGERQSTDRPSVTDPLRTRHGSVTDAAPVLRFVSGSAPALAPSSESMNQRQSAQGAFSNQNQGAQARALSDAELADREAARGRLRRARWSWAAADRRQVPIRLIEELVRSRHCTEMRVAFVLSVIEDGGLREVNKGNLPPNPIGMLINGLGAQRRPKAPWEIPLFFQREWEALLERRQELATHQARLDQARRAAVDRLSAEKEAKPHVS
jgi:uncharacterized protein YdaU (DUF1376 family)